MKDEYTYIWIRISERLRVQRENVQKMFKKKAICAKKLETAKMPFNE
jgi:hypothetical protein